MAVACAVADLLKQRALELDVVMLLEGEEEAGSRGFMETVRRKKVGRCIVHMPFSHSTAVMQDMIGHIDAILVR